MDLTRRAIGDKTSQRSVWIRIMAVFAVVFIALSAFVPSHAFADDDDDNPAKQDHSFYRAASAAASYYEQKHVNKKQTFKPKLDTSDISMAGNYVGFRDQDYDKGVMGFFSVFTLSSQSAAYSAYAASSDKTKFFGHIKTGNTTEGQSIGAYVRYGHALNTLGVDSTGSENFDGGRALRIVLGLGMMMMYFVNVLVDGVFHFLISILKAFNVFGWLYNALTDSKDEDWASAGDIVTNSTPGALKGIASTVSDIYDGIQSLSWGVIPIFFLMLCMSLFLFQNKGPQGTKKQAVAKYFTRFIFIVAGIPLLGGLYTASLDYAGSSDSGAVNANYVLSSNYVDFQNWAEMNRLKMPDSTKIVINTAKSDSGEIDPDTTSIRTLARSINAETNSGLVGDNTNNAAVNKMAGTDKDQQAWNKEALGSGGRSVQLRGNDNVKDPTSSISKSSINAAMDLLTRYMSGTTYSASDFETAYTSQLGPDKSKDLYQLVADHASDQKDMDNDSPCDNDGEHLLFCNTEKGGLSVGTKGDKSTFTSDPKASRGLSPLSMYNYLTTQFTDSNVQTYSSHKLSSGLMAQVHRSVNQVGSGTLQQVLMWLNTLVLMLCVAVIGLFYFFAIVFNNIKRTFKLLASIPMAMLGSIKSIAKVITTVLMMIVEIFGTLVLYTLVMDVMMSFSDIIEAPVQSGFGKWFGTIAITSNGGLNLASTAQGISSLVGDVMLIFSIILYSFFTVMSLRMRKGIINGVDEALAGLIDKFFSFENLGDAAGGAKAALNTPGGGGMMRDAAGAVAGGAGMALGNRMVDNGGPRKDAQAAGTQKPGSGDGDTQVKAAGTTSPQPEGNGMQSDEDSNGNGSSAKDKQIARMGNQAMANGKLTHPGDGKAGANGKAGADGKGSADGIRNARVDNSAAQNANGNESESQSKSKDSDAQDVRGIKAMADGQQASRQNAESNQSSSKGQNQSQKIREAKAATIGANDTMKGSRGASSSESVRSAKPQNASVGADSRVGSSSKSSGTTGSRVRSAQIAHQVGSQAGASLASKTGLDGQGGESRSATRGARGEMGTGTRGVSGQSGQTGRSGQFVAGRDGVIGRTGAKGAQGQAGVDGRASMGANGASGTTSFRVVPGSQGASGSMSVGSKSLGSARPPARNLRDGAKSLGVPGRGGQGAGSTGAGSIPSRAGARGAMPTMSAQTPSRGSGPSSSSSIRARGAQAVNASRHGATSTRPFKGSSDSSVSRSQAKGALPVPHPQENVKNVSGSVHDARVEQMNRRAREAVRNMPKVKDVKG